MCKNSLKSFTVSSPWSENGPKNHPEKNSQMIFMLLNCLPGFLSKAMCSAVFPSLLVTLWSALYSHRTLMQDLDVGRFAQAAMRGVDPSKALEVSNSPVPHLHLCFSITQLLSTKKMYFYRPLCGGRSRSHFVRESAKPK